MPKGFFLQKKVEMAVIELVPELVRLMRRHSSQLTSHGPIGPRFPRLST